VGIPLITKLELGSGARPTPGYLHQDITPQPGVELTFTCHPWEINLPPESLTEVLALGLIEHLRFAEVRKTLRHMRTLLRQGGAFFFDVPDMTVWSEYLFNLTHGADDKNPFTAEHVWSTVYGWQRWPGDEHKSGWTRQSMLAELQAVGYSEIIEGVTLFTEKGLERRRFERPHDAHLYLKAIKANKGERARPPVSWLYGGEAA
jgi:predicted SAM-dependent methyltransferase